MAHYPHIKKLCKQEGLNYEKFIEFHTVMHGIHVVLEALEQSKLIKKYLPGLFENLYEMDEEIIPGVNFTPLMKKPFWNAMGGIPGRSAMVLFTEYDLDRIEKTLAKKQHDVILNDIKKSVLVSRQILTQVCSNLMETIPSEKHQHRGLYHMVTRAIKIGKRVINK